MKKLLILLVFVALGGLITVYVNQSNSSTTVDQSSPAASAVSEKTMAFSPDLQEALDVMKGLQSQVLEKGDQGAITPAELTALGAKVFQISDTFSHNDDRISVLTLDRSHFQTEVTNKLDSLFPTNNNIQAALDILKKPAAFINAYSDYQQQVPSLMASELGISEDQLTSAVDEDFWTSAFEVTKDTREIIARMRGNDWLADYKQDLCVNTDSGVDMIAFDRDADGNISHRVRESRIHACMIPEPGPDADEAMEVADQWVCEDNQLQASNKLIDCPHGCHDGFCKKQKPVLDTTGCSSYYDGCNTCNASGACTKRACEAYKNPHCTVCMDGYKLNNGVCEVEVIVELSHFQLCKANETILVADNFEAGTADYLYEFDLGVIATNSDNSVATSYDGKGLIIITGDNDATYPEQTTLTLDGGVGYFPISLTKTQSTFGQPVTLSYKDATYYINGSEAYADLSECPVIEDDTSELEALLTKVLDLILQGYTMRDILDELSADEIDRLEQAMEEVPENPSIASNFLHLVGLQLSAYADGKTANDLLQDWKDSVDQSYPGGYDQFEQDFLDLMDELKGCTDPEANNYDSSAKLDDGSCEYEEEEDGMYCLDPDADNYSDYLPCIYGDSCYNGIQDGDEEDVDCGGSCATSCGDPFEESNIGCTDPEASNYLETATHDDGSCQYDAKCGDEVMTCETGDASDHRPPEDGAYSQTHWWTCSTDAGSVSCAKVDENYGSSGSQSGSESSSGSTDSSSSANQNTNKPACGTDPGECDSGTLADFQRGGSIATGQYDLYATWKCKQGGQSVSCSWEESGPEDEAPGEYFDSDGNYIGPTY